MNLRQNFKSRTEAGIIQVFGIFCIAAIIIIVSGLLVFRHFKDTIRLEKYHYLKTIADAKSEQILSWQDERTHDAKIYSTGVVRLAILQFLKTQKHDLVEEALLTHFRLQQEEGRYSSIIIVSPSSEALLSLDSCNAEHETEIKPLTDKVMASGEIISGDLYRCPRDDDVYVEIAAPIFDDRGKIAAVIILRSNPEYYLYPLIQSWPVHSKTSETLIVRQDGDKVLFLNPLRFLDAPPLTHSISQVDSSIPAVQAVMGRSGIFQGLDYRGVEVLSDVRHIPRTNWYMISKIDAEEIYAEIRFFGAAIGIIVIVLVMLAGMAAAFVYKHSGKRLFESLYLAERRRREAEEEFSAVLYSIGDAVITTDVEGKVKQMNPIAEAITGWKENEAQGKPIETVFHIINEDTHERVDNPVVRVLKEGVVIGLANHTLLISKEGKEYPIADSGAPIRNERNEIAGVVLVFRDQTEERRAEAALKLSEEKFRLAFDTSPDAVCITRAKDRLFLEVNQGFENITGYTKAELKDKTSLEINIYADPHDRDNIVAELRNKGKVVNYEAKFMRKDGSLMSGLMSAVMIKVGSETCVLSITRDIEAMKQAQEELRLSEEKYRTIIETVPDIYYRTDKDGNITMLSPSVLKILGYDSLEEIIGRRADSFWLNSGERAAMLKKIAAEGKISDYQADLVKKDGAIVHTSVSSTFYKDDKGNILGVEGIIRDISARKIAEEALHESEQRYRDLVELSTDAIMIHQEGRFVFVNSGTLELFKASDRKQLLGQPIIERVHPDYRNIVKNRVSQIIDRGKNVELIEEKFIRLDGTIIDVEVAAIPFIYQGRPAVQVIARDITQRLQTEAAIRISEDRYRDLVENSQDLISTHDLEGNILSVNPSTAKTLGFSVEELLQMNLQDILAPKVKKLFQRYLGTIKRWGQAEGELSLQTKTGEIIVWEYKNTLRTEGVTQPIVRSMARDITDRKLTEQALRESKSILSRAEEIAHIGSWKWDFINNKLSWSEEMYRIFGVDDTEKELDLAKIIQSRIHPEDKPAVEASNESVIQQNNPVPLEYRVVLPDGRVRTVWAEGKLVNDDNGRPTALTGYVQDITERKEAERALVESEARLRTLLTNSPVALFTVDNSGIITFADGKSLENLGLTADMIIGRYAGDLYSDSPHIMDDINSVLQGGDLARVSHIGGRWFDVRMHPLFNQDSAVSGAIGVAMDITEKRKNEEDYQTLFREMLNGCAIHEIICDEEGDPVDYRFLAVNPAFEKMTGLKARDVIGRTVLEVLPETEHYWIETYGRVALTGEAAHFVNLHRGLQKYYDVSAFQPAPNIFACIFEDITERILAQEALSKSEVKFRTLSEVSPTGIYMTDENGDCVFANEKWCQMAGLTREEAMGKGWLDGIYEEDREKVAEEWYKMVESRGKWGLEYRFKDKDGKITNVYGIAAELKDAEGKVVGYVGNNIDITEKEKLQAQLLQAQKMESIGRLAGGVAHDFNNMLGVIIGNAQLALDQVEEIDPIFNELMEIQKAADRSADLTRQLLAFARKQTINPQIIDINDKISSLLKMIKRMIREDIELHWVPGSEVKKINVDPSHLDQILINMAVNSRDAIIDIGSIIISTKNVRLDEMYASLHTEVVPGEYVQIEMTDSGCGMDKKTLSQIFEPFFTTKETGKGTGLGLSTVYGIVSQNKGHIEVYSEPGKGATFKIYFPAVYDPNAIAEKIGLPKPLVGGTETILVVEDEITVLNLVTRMLSQMGYKVISANTVKQALELSQVYAEDIDLLITDVIMPEKTGVNLQESIAGYIPGLKCLYMSGYSADVIASQGDLKVNERYIQKPFSMEDLLAIVRSILDGE